METDCSANQNTVFQILSVNGNTMEILDQLGYGQAEPKSTVIPSTSG